MDLAFDRVRTVFGLAALSRAVVCEKDFDTICRTAEEYLGDSLHGIKTFKVEARRSDKTYPMTSPELMRELGAYLLGLHNYLRVDVKNPQFKVIVEIRDYGAYIHVGLLIAALAGQCIIHICQGWLCVLAFHPLFLALSRPAFGWLLAGGIIYTVGGVIYSLKMPMFNAKHKKFGTCLVNEVEEL